MNEAIGGLTATVNGIERSRTAVLPRQPIPMIPDDDQTLDENQQFSLGPQLLATQPEYLYALCL
jgi:hypothetical protein